MFGRDKASAARVDTLLGRATRIEGDVDFSGGLHLDGHVTGNVRAPQDSSSTLSVSEHGFVDGSVSVPSIVLNGTVRGDIFAATRIALGAKAKVEGNVHYGAIETAIGAEIRGKLVPATNGAVRITPESAEESTG